jgi:hypothetical protein
MRLDTHVHSCFSGYSTIRGLKGFLRESYSAPEHIYQLAKSRGMDLVTITDHDAIEGALTIAHRPDVIVGCEVTATFAHDGVQVHLGVLGLNERQFAEINRLRANVKELLPYLRRERLFVSLNHVASRVNRLIRAEHVAALMPWVDGLEVINGSRLRSQNRTAHRLAQANGKARIAGSDAHTSRGVGQTWVESRNARTREEFMEELLARRVIPGGRHGHFLTMSEDIIRSYAGLYREHATNLIRQPLSWQCHSKMAALLVASPALTLAFAIAAAHFGMEMQFNRSLLYDIGRRPALNVADLA